MGEPRSTSRRGALGRLLQLTAGLGAAGTTLLAGCTAIVGRARRPGIPVGTLDRLPPGAAIRAPLRGDDSVIVINVSGTLRAFLAVCTHEGCPLGWNAAQHLIRCPCHGGAYDTNGSVVSGPPPNPLTELRTVVDKGTIYIIDPPAGAR
jgi:cytochrome b6-f complex iron-sulfur subunit